MHNFTPSLEFDCLKEAISIMRSGDIATQWPDAMKHSTWFIGCALELYSPEDPVIGDVDSDVAEIQNLDELLVQIEAGIPAEGASAISPVMGLMLAKMLMNALSIYLKNK